MPEFKHNFFKGRMNKDADERLVPNGEYRNALNIQVSSSEEDNVGTAQNILGNEFGCADATWFHADNDTGLTPGLVNPFGPKAAVVGSVSDEKNDSLYWMVTDHQASDVNLTSAISADIDLLTSQFPLFSRDTIMRVVNGVCEPVFVDQYKSAVQNESAGGSSIYLPLNPAWAPYIANGTVVTAWGADDNGVVSMKPGKAVVMNVDGAVDVINQVTQLQQELLPGTSFYGQNNALFVTTGLYDAGTGLPIPELNQIHVSVFGTPYAQSAGTWGGIIFTDYGVGDEITLGDDPDGNSQQNQYGFYYPPGTTVVDMQVITNNGTSSFGSPPTLVITTSNPVEGLTEWMDGTGFVNPSTGVLNHWSGNYVSDTDPTRDYFTAGHRVNIEAQSDSFWNGTFTIPYSSPLLPLIENVYATPGASVVMHVDNFELFSTGNQGYWCIDPNSDIASGSSNTFTAVECSDMTTPYYLGSTDPLVLAYQMYQYSSINIQYDIIGSTDALGAALLDAPFDLSDGPGSNSTWDWLVFDNPKVLNFHKDKLLTGVNIIDNMLLWVDGIKPSVGDDTSTGGTEPKKINIDRSVEGTHGSGHFHTKLVNSSRNYGPDSIIERVKEENITVIKKAPTTALAMELVKNLRPDSWELKGPAYPDPTTPTDYSILGWRVLTKTGMFNYPSGILKINGVPYMGDGTGVDLNVGDRIVCAILPRPELIDGSTNFRLDWQLPGEEVAIKKREESYPPDLPLIDFNFRATLTSFTNTGGLIDLNYTNDEQPTFVNSGFLAQGKDGPPMPIETNPLVEMEVTKINIGGLSEGDYTVDSWTVQKPIFEDKFPRFSYRYEYEDGEVSTYAPWTEVGFSPGTFDFHPKKGYNLGMTNRVREIVLSGFVRADMPTDVVSVDILFKDDASPTIYLVDSIKPKAAAGIDTATGLPISNRWSEDKVTITTEIIKGAMPSNQSLRSWDNVPLKAVGQEIVGNRTVYANYFQNMDLGLLDEAGLEVAQYSADFQNSLTTFEPQAKGVPSRSIKSLRDYQVGIIFSDKYGRETPILTSPSGKISLDKSSSSTNNRLKIGLPGSQFPQEAESFRVYVKDSSDEYYNLGMDRFYTVPSGEGLWLSFPSSDRNKITEESFIVLKKAAGGDSLVQNKLRFKVLDIKAEAPSAIKNISSTIAYLSNAACEPSHHMYPGTSYFQAIVPDDNNFIGSEDLKDGDFTMVLEYGDKRSELYNINGIRIEDDTTVGQVTYRISHDVIRTDDNWVGDINNPETGAVAKIIFNVESKSDEFQGKFFVKVFSDSTLQSDLVQDEEFGKEVYEVRASKKIYRMKSTFLDDYGAHDAINPPHSSGSGFYEMKGLLDETNADAAWVAANLHVYHASMVNPFSSTHQAYTGTYGDNQSYGQEYLQTCLSFRQYGKHPMFGTTNSHNSPTGPNEIGSDGAAWEAKYPNSMDSWWKYSNFFYGKMPQGCQNSHPSCDEMYDSRTYGDAEALRNGFWFIDEMWSAGAHSVSQGFKKNAEVGASQYTSSWMIETCHNPNGVLPKDTQHVAHGIDNAVVGTRNTIELSFGGIQKEGGWLGEGSMGTMGSTSFHNKLASKWLIRDSGGSVNTSNWTYMYGGYDKNGYPTGSDYNGENPQRISDQESFWPFYDRDMYEDEKVFAENLKPGAKLRWAEDPNGTIFTVGEVNNYYLTRYENYGQNVRPGTLPSNYTQNFKLQLDKPMDGTTYDPLDEGATQADGTTLGGINGWSPHSHTKTPAIAANSPYPLDLDNYGLTLTAEQKWQKRTYKTLQLLSSVVQNGSFPQNPAIWETEPRESTSDLDIYYEASGSIPTVLTPLTIKTLMPLKSKVHAGTLTQPVEVVGYFGSSIVVGNSDANFTGVFVGTPDQALNSFGNWVQDVIFPGTTLSVVRPDGTAITIKVQDTLNINTNGESNTWELPMDISNIQVDVNWFNCWAYGNGVESNRIRDTFNLPYVSTGATASSVVTEKYSIEHRKTGLIYSGIYNSTSGVNNLNQFIQAEKITKDINPIYGSIQKLYTRDTDLVTLCEDKCLKILANKDALFNADGNAQLTATSKVLGTAVPFKGEYGISKNPESFAAEAYRVYFTDKVRGTVMRLSMDGLTVISDVGMKDWFRDNLKLHNLLVGSYDDRKREYNLSLSPSTSNNVTPTTVTFREDIKGWVSFKSFVTRNGISCANNYYTFKAGQLYIHHSENENRNTFYGAFEDSELTLVINDQASAIKSFQSINYEGSQSRVIRSQDESGQVIDDGEYYNLSTVAGWWLANIETDKEKGSIREFIEKEGKWFNYIKGEEVSINDSTNLPEFDHSAFAVQGLGTALASVMLSTTGCMDSGSMGQDWWDANYAASTGIPTYPAVVAVNYDIAVDTDNGSCIQGIVGCMDAGAQNYGGPGNSNGINPPYNVPDGSCIWQGCTCSGTAVNGAGTVNDCYNDGEPAFNYCAFCNSPGTGIDASCVQAILGCLDNTMSNWCPSCNVDDGSCIAFILGCMDENAVNYNEFATLPGEDCIYSGCVNDVNATNYMLPYDQTAGSAWMIATSNETTLPVNVSDYMASSQWSSFDPAWYGGMPFACTFDLPYANPDGTVVNNGSVNAWPPYFNFGNPGDSNPNGYGWLNTATSPQFPLGIPGTPLPPCPTVSDGSCFTGNCNVVDSCNYSAYATSSYGCYYCNDINSLNYDANATCDTYCNYCDMPTNVVVNNLSIADFTAGTSLPEVSFELPVMTDITNYDHFKIYMRPGGCSPEVVGWANSGCAPGYSWTASHEVLSGSGIGYTTGPGIGYDETDLTIGQPGNPIIIPLNMTLLHHNYAPLVYDVNNYGTLYGVDWNIVVIAVCIVPNGNSTVQVFSNQGDDMVVSAGVTFELPPVTAPILGCTDPNYVEYNPLATIDDGNCNTLTGLGCTDNGLIANGAGVVADLDGDGLAAYNYNPVAINDDGSCYPVIEGCMNPDASNYITPVGDVQVDVNTIPAPGYANSGCIFEGCMDVTSFQYDSTATSDDGTNCIDTGVVGCMDCGTIWENANGITCEQACLDAQAASGGSPMACGSFGDGYSQSAATGPGATNFLYGAVTQWWDPGYGTGTYWPCTY